MCKVEQTSDARILRLDGGRHDEPGYWKGRTPGEVIIVSIFGQNHQAEHGVTIS